MSLLVYTIYYICLYVVNIKTRLQVSKYIYSTKYKNIGRRPERSRMLRSNHITFIFALQIVFFTIATLINTSTMH